jgi:hypothetical protein
MTQREYPFATVCFECRQILIEAKTVEEAQRFATLHTRFTPHLMCFGYDRAKASKIARQWNREEYERDSL